MENFETSGSLAFKPERLCNLKIKRVYNYDYSKYKEEFDDKTEDVNYDRINLTINFNTLRGLNPTE
jgi:hypothetical protein